MKKVLAVTLMSTLVLAPVLSAKDRRGAAAVLTTKAGQEIRGELYAARVPSLI